MSNPIDWLKEDINEMVKSLGSKRLKNVFVDLELADIYNQMLNVAREIKKEVDNIENAEEQNIPCLIRKYRETAREALVRIQEFPQSRDYGDIIKDMNRQLENVSSYE